MKSNISVNSVGGSEPSTLAMARQAACRGWKRAVSSSGLSSTFFSAGQLLGDLLDQAVDVFLSGAGGKDGRKVLLQLRGQGVDVGLRHRRKQPIGSSASGRPVRRGTRAAAWARAAGSRGVAAQRLFRASSGPVAPWQSWSPDQAGRGDRTPPGIGSIGWALLQGREHYGRLSFGIAVLRFRLGQKDFGRRVITVSTIS